MNKDILYDKITDEFNPTWATRKGVKIVSHPLYGNVDVCPFPETHFDELRADAQRVRDFRQAKCYL